MNNISWQSQDLIRTCALHVEQHISDDLFLSCGPDVKRTAQDLMKRQAAEHIVGRYFTECPHREGWTRLELNLIVATPEQFWACVEFEARRLAGMLR